MRKYLIIITFLSLSNSMLLSQVWTLPAKSFDIFASYSLLSYDAIFDSTGDITDLTDFDISDRTIQLTGRYGLNSRITLQAQLPFKLTTRNSEGKVGGPDIQKLNDFGNLEAGVIYQYLEAIPYLTASLFIEANTSDYNFINGLATGYNSWAIRPGLAYKSTYDKLWTSLFAGMEFRTNTYSNNIFLNLESGYVALEKIYIAINIYMRHSFENGTYCDCSLIETAMYPNDQEYFGAGLKGGYQFNAFGLHFGINSAFSGQNVGAAPAVTAGISFRNY